jgi:predicted permease
MLFRRSKSLPENSHKAINAWLIYLALPAVSFKYLPFIQWSNQLIVPALSPIIVWLGAWLFVRLYASYNHIDKGTEGGMKLAAGLSNTSFIGFPLIIAYFGENNLSTGVICDQVTFALLSTAGVIVAIHSSGKHTLSPRVIIANVLRFPPFIGFIAALTLPHFIDITPALPLFDKLSSTVGPLALFSIGLQLKFEGWQQEWKHISAALLYKLVLAPAIVLAVVLLLGLKGAIPQVSIFEAAMPSFVSSAVVAEQYDLNPRLLNLIIGIGILLSFLTTAVWYLVLTFIG